MQTGTSISSGSGELCEDACKDAVAALVLAATDCTALELDISLGISNAADVLLDAQNAQGQCDAPSSQCYRLMQDLQSFEQSSLGVSCAALRDNAANELTASLAQAKSRAYCHSTCGIGVGRYLRELEAAGCAEWAAYRQALMLYESSCTTAFGTYCGSIFSIDKFRNVIDDVLAHRGTVESQEEELAVMCTPCFYEYLRIANRYATVNAARLHVLEKLCVKDGDRYCYPRFHAQLAVASGTSSNARAQALCNTTYMGRCASKMQVRELLREQSSLEPDSERIADLTYDISSMCLAKPDTTSLCASVMSSIIGGYNFEDKQFTGSTYAGPTTCNSVDEGLDCSWACQRDFTADRDLFGCCYEISKSFFTDNNFSDVGEVFSRSDTLARECNREAEPSCPILSQSTKVSTSLLIGVPLWFIERPSTLPLINNDVLRATGLSAAAISVYGFRYNSPTTSWVDFSVVGQTHQVVSMVLSDVADLAIVGSLVHFETESAYNNECHLGGGASC